MNRHLALCMLLLAAAAVVLTGCTKPPAVEEPDQEHPEGPVVTLTAYINVSSGCQQPTVDVIKELASKHEGKLSVEFVDFGDKAEGMKAWKAAGLTCMALQINGVSTVAWGEGDERRTVTFEFPVGFSWTHEDLAEAIEAALEGHLEKGDPEEAEGLRLLQVEALGQSVKEGDTGPETGQLVIADAVVVEVTQERGELDPAQRVTAAAETLTRALTKPFKPDSLALEQVEEGWAVLVGDETLLVATSADAEAAEVQPKKLAGEWSLAIREALAKAARPGGP